MHQAKKLAAASVTSMLMTISLEALKHISCIWYLVQFQGRQNIKALLDSGSKVNTITPVYRIKLGLKSRHINVDVKKIDGSVLKTHDMASACFLLQHSQGTI